ncbi:probable serine/threonine-protein kinase MARK-A isoform X2 [Teleopsis dalmanni]|uniref:probable serine/threonine-protein kinase MARK-A isoform X2 n=1 Tax=Teleopsis dalmanni TaxID=139649 RepID=UPI0018CCCA24|nr:probable serine/threonine-protein kinase MARK-A isoform X2 [Teleopsis dalmanni]
MIAMLIVVTFVISGNGVFAAQRDSFKQKDPNNISESVNAILNSMNTNSSSNGNGNALSIGNTNNISNGNNNANSANNIYAATTSISTRTVDGSTTAAMAIATTTATTATTTATTTANVSNYTIASGSLQKGSRITSGNSGINTNTIDIFEDSNTNGPYFDRVASKNVTALLGKTAYLNCRVKNLGNKTMLLQVSWVRHRDVHLLTVGRYTYTSDQRFRAIHQPQTDDWTLQIKYPQHRDSGIYECQISTTPHMSHYIYLNVVEPSTEIIGAPDLYIESGSTINITCVITNCPEPPAYIIWNHNDAIISENSIRGGVKIVLIKGETTISSLLIESAQPTDSGLYQCSPSNAKPKSVTIHILNGKYPAAMQRAARQQHRMPLSLYVLIYLSIYFCCSIYAAQYMKLRTNYVEI